MFALLIGVDVCLLVQPIWAESGVSNVTTVDQLLPLSTGCVAPIVGYVNFIGGDEYAKACPIGDNRFRFWCSNGTVFDYDQFSSDPVSLENRCVAPYGTFFSIEGGAGGGGFITFCPPGQYLVGFDARAGAWVDNLGGLCATYDVQSGALDGVTPLSRQGGSGGAHVDPVKCSSRTQAIARIQFFMTIGTGGGEGFVELPLAELPEGSAAGAKIGRRKSRLTRKAVPPTKPMATVATTCRLVRGQLAIGIQGRSGQFVDALGLICGPRDRAKGRFRRGPRQKCSKAQCRRR